jgi:tetratricopeptide (TPR) repeat protein
MTLPEEQETIEELMDDGFSAIRARLYHEAARVGRQLLDKRHSSGFEILALALGEDRQVEEAVAVLEEGVSVAPDVWLLWQLLGNYRSDSGNFAGALDAYDHALFCEGADKDSIYLNIATVLARQENPDEALSYLNLIEDIDIRLCAGALKVRLLDDTGQEAAARELATSTFEQLESRVAQLEDEEEDAAKFSNVYARLGMFFLKIEEENLARQCWERSWQLDRTDEDSLALARDLDPQTSPDAKYFNVMVEGSFVDDDFVDDDEEDIEDNELQEVGFYVTYGIVAASEDEVMDWVRAFEPVELHDSLHLVECEAGDPCPDYCLGVYSITGYATFLPENTEEDDEEEEHND